MELQTDGGPAALPPPQHLAGEPPANCEVFTFRSVCFLKCRTWTPALDELFKNAVISRKQRQYNCMKLRPAASVRGTASDAANNSTK